MSDVLANSIVVIAIALSGCYAVWRLGPRKMRDALRLRLRKTLPSVFGNLADPASGSGCDACGGGGCAPQTTSQTTKQPGASKEHSVIWRKKSAR